jgi:tetratricopeptide (TPR) repeat protein
LGDWAKADENATKAAELARQSAFSTRAAYVSAWAMLPVAQANRLASTRPADDPEVLKLLQTAEQRAALLQGMPAGAFIIPTKQVAVILGAARQKRKEYDKAVNAYDQALPQDLAQADALDVPLLLARADCNLNRPEAKKDAAFAQAALRDASKALELAAAAPDQAAARYRMALAHFSLFGQGGDSAIQHRDRSLEDIREAVRLAPPGVHGATYRHTGAIVIANVIAEMAKADPKKAVPYYEEAERWLREALDLLQDSSQRKTIEANLKLFQEALGKLRGAPPDAASPNSGE